MLIKQKLIIKLDRYGSENRSLSNKSMDSTARFATKPPSEARNMVLNALLQQATGSGTGNTNPNRNSLIDAINSNRSSMDVSTCSYNTLIIHNEENMFPNASGNLDGANSIQDKTGKKDHRLRSYEQGMQEITEIPDDYLNQSHVLKHLAKEIKIPPTTPTSSNKRNSLEANEGIPIYKQWIMEEQTGRINNKLKSKSQPELTRYCKIYLHNLTSPGYFTKFLMFVLGSLLLTLTRTLLLMRWLRKIKY